MGKSFANYFNDTNSGKPSAGSPFIIAQVTKVILGLYLEDGKTLDNDYVDITSIGSIKYTILNSAQSYSNTGDSNKIARPAFSFVHQYPVQGEFVYLIPGPGLNQNEEAGAPDYYYLPPFNLWRAPNHNAFANLGEYADYINLQKLDYHQNEQGLTNKPNQSSIAYPLGNGFIEMGNISSLQPFVGDLLFEGRYGQSIRFGSTLTSNKGSNTWSDSGTNGDPIVLIRNGQGGKANDAGYYTTVENINVDKSSIYLTAGQRIVIDDIQKNFPLTSWGVTLESTNTTTVAELTVPPLAGDTLSAQQQDKSTIG